VLLFAFGVKTVTNHTNGWLTIREAALALGISELTIRRRIKDGRLPHRLDNGKYYVTLASQSEDEQPAARQTDQRRVTNHMRNADRARSDLITRDSHQTVDLDALLAEHARLAETAGKAAVLQDRVQELEERHRSLQDGIVALANRNGWLESKLDEREREIKLLSDSSRRQSWWRRLLGLEEAAGRP
jgi:excisionase family DNA binding protein